jgi:CHAD domain-containing protein
MPRDAIPLRVSARELHTILAALRCHQEAGQCRPINRSQWLEDIATNLGEVRPLDTQEIDCLCEKLNVTREEPP